MKSALASGHVLHVSTVSLAESLYLDEKGRIPGGTFQRVIAELRTPASSLVEAAFTAEVAEAMRSVPRQAVPDFPDRMIAATALYLGLPLVSSDRRMRSSGQPVIW